MNDQVDAIFRAIQFMEAHLESEVTVSQIADEVGYSLFHFMRIFNRLVHHTPYDYLTRRRLSEAAKQLISNDRRIIDIAQDFCFNNQESFSRAFKRMFHIQPSQWRENRIEITHLLMPPRTVFDLKFINDHRFKIPGIENLEEICYFGLMTALKKEDEWFKYQVNGLYEDLMDFCGCEKPAQLCEIFTCRHQKAKNRYIFLGIKKQGPIKQDAATASFLVPAGKYARISAMEADSPLALTYLIHTWIPQKGFEPLGRMIVSLVDDDGKNLTRRTIYIPIKSYDV